MPQDQSPQFTPYPAYKPSGVEWLGDVPSHWQVGRIRDAIAFRINGVWGSDPDGTHDLPCVRVADFDRKRLRVNEPVPTIRAILPNQRRNRVLQYGDLLLEKSGGGAKQPVGVVMLFDHETPAVCSNFIARMSVKDGFDPFFITFLFSALYSIGLNIRSIKQTTGIQNLDALSYLNEYVPIPPLAEQRAIAAYLDRMGDLAHRYADVAARIIALLRELRQSEIHQAVARGLDEDAPLRPSGVEWIGDIPDHWQMRRLKYSAKLIMGQSPDGRDCAETPIGLPFLQGCAEFGGIHPTHVLYCRAPRKISPIGAILLSVRSPVGRLNFADQEYVIGRGLCAIIPDGETLDATFAYYHLLSLDTGLRMASTGSTYDAVSVYDIGTQPIIAPPLAEQREIAAHLDARTAAIDAGIAYYERMAALVSEYWASLTMHAVTGQMDVRDMA